VRLLLWILVALVLCVVQHTCLAGWTITPDLPLALAAYAVVAGLAQPWILRLWIIGPIRDVLDPGSEWFHAGVHVLFLLAVLPTQRWLPGPRWLALIVAGTSLALLHQALDILIGGPGAWRWWSGSLNALLTGGAAMAFGWLAPPPKRTVSVPEEPAEEAEAITPS
jgi:hypothetical protein